MIDSLYAVILAGGKGERFWPLSTPEHPKPFLRFFSERSLLQQTFERACRLVPKERIFLVVGRQHQALSQQQLPELSESQLLLEPCGRDTAAAIGYASLHLPYDVLMLVLPADHLIPDEKLFAETIESAVRFVHQHGGPMTFDIAPDRAETNYGYICAGKENLAAQGLPVYRVEQFIEKPDHERAEEFIRQSSYYWNSGIFLWRVSRIQELIGRFLPELWQGLQEVRSAKHQPGFRQSYEHLPPISIDFGVMQKAEDVLVVPVSFRWD